MSNKKIKTLTPTQIEYKNFAKQRVPKYPLFSNVLRAFFAGGVVATIGQGLQMFFIRFFNFNEVTAGNPTLAVLILLSVILTGLGVYDHIARWAGAGVTVPVTGFANTIASAALEHKSEGFVLGVGGNMFKIAGPVIVFGVVAAFVVALIKLLIQGLGGI